MFGLKIYKYEQKPSVQFVIKWFPVSGGGAPVVVSVVLGGVSHNSPWDHGALLSATIDYWPAAPCQCPYKLPQTTGLGAETK